MQGSPQMYVTEVLGAGWGLSGMNNGHQREGGVGNMETGLGCDCGTDVNVQWCSM